MGRKLKSKSKSKKETREESLDSVDVSSHEASNEEDKKRKRLDDHGESDNPSVKKTKTKKTTTRTKKTATAAAAAAQPITETQQRQPPTANELHDAITWLLIQFQVECVHCGSYESVANDIIKLTRLLAEQPYQKQVTEIQCVRKIKPECSDMDNDYDRAKDCWIRQLQQIPRVSVPVAHNLAYHYPTAMTLWETYHNPNIPEHTKRTLLADCLSSTNTKQTKLSDWIYRVLTSNNPNEILR